MKNIKEIDVAICYHKPSVIFQSDALIPMQLNKELSEFELDMRGDNTGDHISERNRFYSEDTALYWLWKNSKADIKGCLHYRRLLDLSGKNKKNYTVILEDIENPNDFVKEVGLTNQNITKLMSDYDILIRNKTNIRDFFDGTIEENFKAIHIQYHWDIAMDIIKKDFPDIYPTALLVANSYENYFHNQVIMKAELFDKMCEFCFHLTEEIAKQIDETRLEFNNNWRYTARYLSFIFERMVGVYIHYLQKKGYKVKEFAAISVVPRENQDIENLKNYENNAYQKHNKEILLPAFDNKNAVTIMLSSDNNYAPYMAVFLKSLIEHSNPSRNYDIVIANRNISTHNQKLITKMQQTNISIRFINISKYFNQYGATYFQTCQHFSIDAYSRIFIPEIFGEYKKVLYLDIDMIILKDIAELFDTDIGQNWWGVVQDSFFPVVCHSPKDNYFKRNLVPYIKNTLKMDSLSDYFNSGVMIWNIEQCKKDNVVTKAIIKLQELKNPKFVDQCILNSIANGKNIFWLSPFWNVSWNVEFDWHDGYGSESYNTALNFLENPYILHFTGAIKPWKEPWRDRAEIFWEYARKTPFHEQIFAAILFSVFDYLWYIRGNANKNIQTNKHLKKKYKKKLLKYKVLNFITLGLVKSIKKRKKHYKHQLALIDNNI